MTASEQFVYSLCKRSFLSLWSIANPQGKTAKQELCDVLVLVVCEPDIIIFSVKEIEYRPSGDVAMGWRRWTSRAIEASAKQIYGAERILGLLSEVKQRNGTIGIKLPQPAARRIHRVAVALGSNGEVPRQFGDLGKGFVHVFDEATVSILLRELDTISDFVEYLTAKEQFLSSDKVSVMMSGEEDLLAWYLHIGRSFPTNYDLVILNDDMWTGISAKEEFLSRRRADEESYAWDRMIEYLVSETDPDLKLASLSINLSRENLEHVVRVMARENRFARRILAKSFAEFLRAGNIRSRTIPSPSGVIYVFLVHPHVYDRSARAAELLGRCFIARGLNPEATTVVGLATDQYGTGEGFTLDACCYEKPDWTAEDQQAVEELQKATGAFVEPRLSRVGENEFPSGNSVRKT